MKTEKDVIEVSDFYHACILKAEGYRFLTLAGTDDPKRKVFVFEDDGNAEDTILAFDNDELRTNPKLVLAASRYLKSKLYD